MTTTEYDIKIRENRLRRMAARQGFTIVKSRRRDPLARDFGTYMVVDPETNGVVLGHPTSGPNGSATLDDVEEWLNRPWDE